MFGASGAWAADWIDKDDPNVTYTALKYIKGKATAQATGGGWFVLPIKPNGTDIVKMRFKLATTAWTQFLWCNRAGSSLAKYPKFGAYFSAGGNIQCQRNTGNTASNTNPGTGECSIEVNYNTLKFYVNGTEQSDSLVSGSFDPPAANTMLFASNIQVSGNTANYIIADTIPAKNVSNRGSYYLYDFQIYDSATNLTHNIVPAMRDTDSVTGLYDTATGTFYTKAKNSGEFDTEEWGADRAGKKWTGLGGDNKMSTGANWEGGVAPQAGDDIDFTIAVPFAAIEADIDATFGKIYLGMGDLPAFSGALSATGINDLERMTAYDTATDGFVFTLAAPSGQDLVWNGGDTENWNATDKSWLCNGAASAWYDHNNAVFNVDGATATLTKNAAPDALVFSQSATIAGTATLTVSTVSVAADVAATITAPTDGELSKTGEGSLTLGSSRTEQTTLSEGTLAMASGATLDWSKLTLGTDPAKPVSLNLGGAGLSADLTSRMSATVGGAAGGSVAIDNGAITNTTTLRVWNGSLTLGRDMQVTMNGSDTWVCVGGNNSDDESVTTKDAYLVLDGASIKERVSGLTTRLGIGDFGSYPSKATMIVKNGGSFTTDNSAYVAQGCEGHLVIDGEGSSVTAYQLLFCNAARCLDDENGYVVVTNGGTLVVDRLGYGSGKGEGYFRFDGGTLRAKTTNETLLPAHEKLHYIVGELGGTIDNNGKNITIAKVFSGPGMIDLTGSGKTTFAAGVGVDAEGGVYVDTDTTLTINGATQSYLGMLILQKGSTLDIAIPASDIAAFAATELLIPEEGAVTLTSGGGAFGEGLYAICKMSGVTAEAGAKFAPLISTETLEFEWSVVDNTLMLTVGAIDGNTWTGSANDSNLSNPKNWLGGAVPTSGTVTINTSGTLTVGDKFNPDVIVFPETCGDITISGENSITGIMAITNLSSSTCTFAVPVSFANKIDVYQTAYYYTDGSSTGDSHEQAGGHVRFAGGVTGTGFAEGTTHRLDGAYTIPATAGWVANTQNNVWTLPDATAAGGSSFITITGSSHDVPGTTDTSMLLIGSGCAFTTGVVRTSKRLSYRIYGEYVVTNELEVALTSDTSIAQRYSAGGKYKFEKLTLSDSGTSDGYIFWLANSTTREGAAKQVYIGAGGVSINAAENKNTALSCGTLASDVTHLYPWHSDYSINGKGGSTRDLIIFRATNLYTDDENGVARTVTLNGVADVRAALTVKGSGRFQVNSNGMNGEGSRIGGITVADSATLAYASGADLGAGAVTVGASATMEIASGEHTFDGGLTLNDGATLAFNFTERTVTPQIAIAEGKTLTVNGAVKVKIPADSKWPTGGEKILTTCGGFDAEGVTVSLAEGAPKWAKSVYVNADGNIVLDVKPMGTRVIVR
ncbi:MAG: hypothetical protein IKC27_05040 [Kiritimatiellae bacterium]|nr:hypothetical protein [Kiritimatiellia bacterium]